jgi:hypothetical protein
MTRNTPRIFGSCICRGSFVGYGNSARPVADDGECCIACNERVVIPARCQERSRTGSAAGKRGVRDP